MGFRRAQFSTSSASSIEQKLSTSIRSCCADRPPRRKPGRAGGPKPDQIGRAVDDKVLTAVRILFGSSIGDEAMRREKSRLEEEAASSAIIFTRRQIHWFEPTRSMMSQSSP